jgi:hypothetical protein
MCKYDHWIFGKTLSLSTLTYQSLCGIHSGYSSRLILLSISPHYGSITLDPVFSSVSPMTRGQKKDLFVEVLMTGSTLGAYSNCLIVPGEEPSLVSASFRLGALNECLVIGFLGGIFPATRR